MAGNDTQEKTHTLSFRLSEKDYTLLTTARESLHLSQSDYLRYLLRIPLVPDGPAPIDSYIVLDQHSLSSLARELKRWGHHYNQAVHAMNSIAMHMRNGTLDDEWYVKMLTKIDSELLQVNEGCYELGEKIEHLQQSALIGEI